jgi:molecular chaperone DnaK
MYLGIDLGTSNSAIVGNRGGTLELFKAVSGEDVLASVVMRDRNGGRYVGKRAYDQLRIAPEGIAARFKRLLGTSTTLPFGNEGDTITPEEASTEVLRQLLKQVRAGVGDTEIQGAVVTVPAAFNQMQSEATIRAALAAELGQVGLLQEPVAAALACLERPESRTGLFLVYDLGGGTFDVALVRAIDGSVSIEAHEGINMLGGSDFDRMIVDSIVRPWLKAEFQLPDDAQERPEFRRLIALALSNAEQAKIELSTSNEAMIFVSEREVGATDLAGRPIYIEAVLTRDALEELVSEKVDRSIELCRKVIADNGYTPQDISKVVLIGGPSRMPIVRRRVPLELGIETDLDIDPMTAVARGAAVYAESRQWSDGETVSKKSRVQQDAGARVSYDFEARTAKDRARIRVTAVGDATGLRVTATASDGRDYGERLVAEGPIFTVQLGAGETKVTMTVVDAEGARIEDACAELVVTRISAVAAGAPCTSTIAVKVEDGDGVRSINILEPIVRKGEMLPQKGVKALRSARKLAPGATDWIDIELYEQAEGVLEPEANLLIGSFRLSGEDLPPHVAPLMPGDQVVVHWQIDDSQLIRCSVEIPEQGLHLRDHSFYVDDLARIDFGTNGRAFATDALTAVDRSFDAISDTLRAHCQPEIAVLRRRLDQQFDRLRTVDEADGYRSITEEARLIRQEISRLRHRPDLRAAVLASDLAQTERLARQLTASMSESSHAQVQQHYATAQRALDDGQFKVAERAIEAMASILHRVLTEQPDFLIDQFAYLRREQRHAALDIGRFDALVMRGDAAIAARSFSELRNVIGEIYSILSSTSGRAGDAAALAGLRR